MTNKYYDAPTKYADIALSAAEAVCNNGLDILQRPKYKNQIKYTLIRELENHICLVYYLNSDEEIICSAGGRIRGDFPIINEEITVVIPSKYIKDRAKK